MSGPLSQLLASGCDLHVDGRVYRAVPLTIEDWDEVTEEILAKRPDSVAIAKELAAAMEPADRKEFLAQAYDDAKRAAVVSAEEMLSYKTTLRGQSHICWLSLRKAHPELTRADVSALLELKAREYFQAALEELRQTHSPDITWDEMMAAAKELEEGAVLEMVMRLEGLPEGNSSPP